MEVLHQFSSWFTEIGQKVFMEVKHFIIYIIYLFCAINYIMIIITDTMSNS